MALYKRCGIDMLFQSIASNSNEATAKVFRGKCKRYFGVSNLDGMSDADQVKKLNMFWRQLLEPIPNTVFIRAWLEDNNSLDEYVSLFHSNWCKSVISVGALQ